VKLKIRKRLDQIIAEAANNPASDIYEVVGPHMAAAEKAVRRATLVSGVYLLMLATVIALEAIYVWPILATRLPH
jgi:hypothetical protein